MGAYECTLSYLTKNTMSPLSKVYFSVLSPYLPAVTINNDEKKEWTILEEKSMTWVGGERVNSYYINFYDPDSQALVTSLTTKELFIDFTDILEKRRL